MRVLCSLPNAADEINGVAFTRTDAGMLSADIDEATAAVFLRIPGYTKAADEPPRRGRPPKSTAADEA